MTHPRIACGFASLLLVAVVTAAFSNDAAAQTRRRPAAPQPPLPGYDPNMPADARQVIEKQLEQQLDERTKRKAAAFREAEKLKRQYGAEVNRDGGRTASPSDPVSASEPDGDTPTSRPEDGRIGNPAYDAPNSAAALLFHAGLLYLDAERWPAAQSAFETIVEQHAESIWALESRLCLFDMAFEIGLDPSAAAGVLGAAVDWARTVQTGPPPKGPQVVKLLDSSGVGGGALPLQRPGPVFGEGAPVGGIANPSDRKDDAPAPAQPEDERISNPSYGPRAPSVVAAEVRLRAGLLAWLTENPLGAEEHFVEAFRLNAVAQSPINELAAAVVRHARYAHTPEAAREGDVPVVARLIVYADLLHNGLQMYRAHRLWDGLLTKRQRDLSPLQRSYALLRRGHVRTLFRNALEKRPDLVLKDYEQSRAAARAAPWADQALLLAGNAAWHLKHDKAQAIGFWQTLRDDYPDSPHAPQAAYFIGTTYELSGDWEQAYLAFEDARKRHPNSGFDELIEKHLRTVSGQLTELPVTDSAAESVPVRQRSRSDGSRP